MRRLRLRSSRPVSSELSLAPKGQLSTTGQCTFPESNRLEARIGDLALIKNGKRIPPSLNRAAWRAAPASCAGATDRTTP
jgi:hypothetical protein